ncbi:hypothetical protein K469DRAFT_747273 [Zopfia rhizophila CBS 207.26]|uniref:Uncharacterized protein n=1 Tax=Zopfia rhizophila CBS 207.26 TaxID=1314779 RepID=A0A6A6EFR5_9PEZI|nr:hypothetical protein K469DRAFT_747273 [Zopfia rhizophila CBS 207.26]
MSSLPEENIVLFVELGLMTQQLEMRNEKEDWTGIANPIERRRLQNRLNQSIYSGCNPVKGRSRCRAAVNYNGSEDSSLSEGDNKSSRGACINSNPRIEVVMKLFAQHAYDSYVQGAPVLAHLPKIIQFNISTALACNAKMLGVSTDWLEYDVISPFNKQGPELGLTLSPTSADWPASLNPTPLQSTFEHHPWVELFPLPPMRDNFLQTFENLEICDEDGLCRDLCQYGECVVMGEKLSLNEFVKMAEETKGRRLSIAWRFPEIVPKKARDVLIVWEGK